MAGLSSPVAHRVFRVLLIFVIASGAGLAFNRLRRTPEQVELAHYIELDLPALMNEQHAITDELDVLMQSTKLPADNARKRLVDQITPRLVKLRRRAEAFAPATVTVRQLAAEHLNVLDAWTEAARVAVRAIEDPTLSTEAGFAAVRERLADAARSDKTWRAHVVQTCEHNRLAPPSRSPEERP